MPLGGGGEGGKLYPASLDPPVDLVVLPQDHDVCNGLDRAAGDGDAAGSLFPLFGSARRGPPGSSCRRYPRGGAIVIPAGDGAAHARRRLKYLRRQNLRSVGAKSFVRSALFVRDTPYPAPSTLDQGASNSALNLIGAIY